MLRFSEYVTPKVKKTVHDGFENHVGVLSLTESPDNLLMWAHYANSYQGFVVEFDADHGFFDQRKSEKDELRQLVQVTYSQARPSPAFFEVSSFTDFLVKSADWSYEKEWRMLQVLEDSDYRVGAIPYDIHLFQVQFDAIKSVRIGARASDETRENILNTLNAKSELNGIAIYQMSIDDQRFAINAERIK